MTLIYKSSQQNDFDSTEKRGTVKRADIDVPPYPDMLDIIEDWACDNCDGEMLVGDYVCWGMCYACAKAAGKLPKFLS